MRSVEITDCGPTHAWWYTIRLIEDGEQIAERNISRQELYGDPRLGQFAGRHMEDLTTDQLFIEAVFPDAQVPDAVYVDRDLTHWHVS